MLIKSLEVCEDTGKTQSETIARMEVQYEDLATELRQLKEACGSNNEQQQQQDQQQDDTGIAQSKNLQECVDVNRQLGEMVSQLEKQLKTMQSENQQCQDQGEKDENMAYMEAELKEIREQNGRLQQQVEVMD